MRDGHSWQLSTSRTRVNTDGRGRRFYISEEMEMGVREWLRMQEADL